MFHLSSFKSYFVDELCSTEKETLVDSSRTAPLLSIKFLKFKKYVFCWKTFKP